MAITLGVRPNIVVVLTDDQTAGEIDTNTMPLFVARMAAEDGWLDMANLMASTPKCECARANLFTGQRTDHHNGTVDNPDAFDLNQTECCNYLFQAAGAITGVSGKWENLYDGTFTPLGWDFSWLPWQPSNPGANEQYLDYQARNTNGSITTYGAINTTANYSTDVTFAKATQFVEDNANPSGAPIFLWVAPEAPHRPYIPAARHASSVVGTAPARPSDTQTVVTSQPAWIRALPAYSAGQTTDLAAIHTAARRTMLAIDDGLDTLLDKIEAKGIADNTMVVFLTDNGNHWGRFKRLPEVTGGTTGSYLKQTNYPEVIRSSCRIRWPGATGRTITELASTLDLTATWYHLMGISPPSTVTLDGVTLAHLIMGLPVPWRSSLETCWRVDEGANVPPWWGLWRSDAMWVEWDAGDKELYDLGGDPDCTTSLHASGTWTATRTAMAARLAALKDETDGQALDAGRPRVVAGGVVVKVPLRVKYAGTPVEALVSV